MGKTKKNYFSNTGVELIERLYSPWETLGPSNKFINLHTHLLQIILNRLLYTLNRDEEKVYLL